MPPRRRTDAETPQLGVPPRTAPGHAPRKRATARPPSNDPHGRLSRLCKDTKNIDTSLYVNQLPRQDPGYAAEEARLGGQFRTAQAVEDHVPLSHPRLDAMFNLAVEDGHAGGSTTCVLRRVRRTGRRLRPGCARARPGGSPQVYSLQALAAKVALAGVPAVVAQGITADQVPAGELRSHVAAATAVYAELALVVGRIQSMLDRATASEGGEQR